MATIVVGAGETSNGLAISSGNSLEVLSGGIVSGTTVVSAFETVSGGGLAVGTLISAAGWEILRGGDSISTTLVGINASTGVARQFISSGSVASGAIVSAFGTTFISNGGIASDTVLLSRGAMYIYSGGSAVSVTPDDTVKVGRCRRRARARRRRL